MDCPFVEVGCNVTKLATRASYQKHLSENTEQHLQMVMKLHMKAVGTSFSESDITEYNVVSPIEKLDAVNKEFEFLEGFLESYEMNQIPSLECIKTVLKSPDIWIRKLGDACAFRMPNFFEQRAGKLKWLSPPFFVQDGYKMRICVYANGTGSGANTHISVSLLLLFVEQLEWPICLPPHLGIRVELVDEGEDDSLNAQQNFQFIWKSGESSATRMRRNDLPMLHAGSSKHIRGSRMLLKRQTGLPPWCIPPPNYPEEDMESASKPNFDKFEDITLITTEKFAPLSVIEDFARDFNSLVFRVALCLV